MKKSIALLLLGILSVTNIFAAERTINLVVAYKKVHYAGQDAYAIAVNNQIPGPTLHFRQGDHVTINVYNSLDQETAIHWHGLLVPWQMDGVLGVTQKGIPPKGMFKYQFTLKQSGTYWYHAHAGLQEQQGLYGGLIIDPPQPPPFQYTRDVVIVLSDWSNTNPDQILANLKKEGDYYAPRFPLQPSLMKFISDYRKASRAQKSAVLEDYKAMQQMRMGIYDLSDVAYDAFLLNGHPNSHPWTSLVKAGDVVRLRFIGAGADTIFKVKIPDTRMTMVHVDGNDVVPHEVSDFTIAPGETYDVLVRINKDAPYIIYAESRNTLGAAYGALITAPNQTVNYSQVAKFPEPPPVTREMMDNMMMGMAAPAMHHHEMKMDMSSHESMKGMKMDEPASQPMKGMKMDEPSSQSMKGMKMDPPQSAMKMKKPAPSHHAMKDMNMDPPSQHAQSMSNSMNMAMSTEPSMIGDKISYSPETVTFGTKYQNLTANVKTNDPDKPVAGVIKMELFGYMDRYIWFINGVPEYNAHPIPLESGKRYRIVFINNSMMRHPMHIHGHWFILRNGHGVYDPLLHTIDVASGSTVTADLDADASGQWFFHCHLLYHMATGMSRVFQYSTLIEITSGEAAPQDIDKNSAYINRPIVRVDEVRPIDKALVKHPMAHPPGLWMSTYIDIGADPFHNAQMLTYKGMYGPDYNKLQLFINDAEADHGTVDFADIDVFYWRLMGQFWSLKGGANYSYRPALTPYWQPGIGLEALLPYFIDTDVRGYYHSGSAKLDVELSRDTQITNNFLIRLGIRGIAATKTVTQAAIGTGLNQIRYIARPYYRIAPGISIFAEYEHEQDYGAYNNILQASGQSSTPDTITFGLTFLI